MHLSVERQLTDEFSSRDLITPVTEDLRLNLVETRTFGSRVIYERYGRAPDQSD